MISVVDPEAWHGHTIVHHTQDGCTGPVAVEPDTGLVTAGALAQATGADNHKAVVSLVLLDAEDAGELEVLGDSAYGTADARAVLAERGHRAVSKPMLLRPAVQGGVHPR